MWRALKISVPAVHRTSLHNLLHHSYTLTRRGLRAAAKLRERTLEWKSRAHGTRLARLRAPLGVKISTEIVYYMDYAKQVQLDMVGSAAVRAHAGRDSRCEGVATNTRAHTRQNSRHRSDTHRPAYLGPVIITISYLSAIRRTHSARTSQHQ